jgi:hypothetical protein
LAVKLFRRRPPRGVPAVRIAVRYAGDGGEDLPNVHHTCAAYPIIERVTKSKPASVKNPLMPMVFGAAGWVMEVLIKITL